MDRLFGSKPASGGAEVLLGLLSCRSNSGASENEKLALILFWRCSESLSKAVLKSSRMIVSVKHLKTNAIFQKGFRPPRSKTEVTARTSRMMNKMLKHMLNNIRAKREEVRINSK